MNEYAVGQGLGGPSLVMDATVIRRQLDEIRRELPGVQVHYAVKCNPTLGVLEAVHEADGGFEIASGFELMTLESIGVDAADVLFSNPVKGREHIATAHAAGLWRFAVDSASEVHKIAQTAPGAAVYVRLRVDDTGSMFPLSRKYGCEIDEAVELLLLARQLGLDPYGVTFHVGSQSTVLGVWRDAISRCGTLMRMLDHHGIRLRMLDLGGGLPADYGRPVPNLAAIGAEMRAALDRLPYRPERLVIEPGRFLVAQAGTMLATVIGVRPRGDERWLHLDVGGYGGLWEAAETGGRWTFPVTAEGRLYSGELGRFVLTGPTCDSGDTILYDVELPVDVREGDRIAIGCAGAYSVAFATSFNGFPPPLVTVVDPQPAASTHAPELVRVRAAN